MKTLFKIGLLLLVTICLANCDDDDGCGHLTVVFDAEQVLPNNVNIETESGGLLYAPEPITLKVKKDLIPGTYRIRPLGNHNYQSCLIQIFNGRNTKVWYIDYAASVSN